MPHPRKGPVWYRADGSFWGTRQVNTQLAMRSLFNPNAPAFFLRELVENPRRHWWCPWRDRWIYGERTWEGRNPLDDGFKQMKETNQ